MCSKVTTFLAKAHQSTVTY